MQSVTLSDFLSDAFGREEGYVYAPHERSDDKVFIKKWYKWPDELDELSADVFLNAETGNTYLSPVLYSDREFTFKASSFVWADFDEGIPDTLEAFSPPTYRIHSGGPGKEHWYWKLDTPITNKELLEDYNRRVIKAFGADKVAWNYNRILRPIDGLNHKYDPPKRVIPSEYSGNVTAHSWFSMLPENPKISQAINTSWDYAEYDYTELRDPLVNFITQPEPAHRAAALFSIARSLNELGWNRDKVLSVLSDCATRWGKWTGRNDRNERLCGVYASATATKESQEGVQPFEKPSPLPLSTVYDILSQQYEVDWIIPGLLKSTGFMAVSAAAGVGKTTLALNLMLALASAKRFLRWDLAKPRKTLFMSLEMDEEGLQLFLRDMERAYRGHEQDVAENIKIYNSFSYRLNRPENQAMLLETIDQHGFDGIVFDSLSRISDDLNGKEAIDKVFDFIANEIIRKRKMFVIVLHHEGKGSTQGDQRNGQEKMYGSAFIPAWVDTVARLIKIGDYDDRGIKFTVEKGRYMKHIQPINCFRDDNLILVERIIKKGPGAIK